MAFQRFAAQTDGSGNATVMIDQQITSIKWVIHTIVIQAIPGVLGSGNSVNPRPGNVVMQFNTIPIANTFNGLFDIATGPPDIVLGAGDTLTIIWTNSVVSFPVINILSTVQVFIFYDELPA